MEIKELLTYRMKSQRYPLSDLEVDIGNSQVSAFNYKDLKDMLLNQPFYLTENYATQFLNYCFQKDTIDKAEKLNNTILIQKLKKVIEPFELLH